jgi:hypothetical protein
MTEPFQEQIIRVEADEEIAAIRDRLTWAEAPRVVLVISRRNKAMRDKMNLKLIQRTAIDQAITVALVAHHRDTVRLAEEIGLPVFWTARVPFGFRNWNGGAAPKFVPDDDGDEVKIIAPTGPRMGLRYRILGVVLLMALVFVVASLIFLLAPTARITLSPVSDQTTINTVITASASIKNLNTALRQIPATVNEIPLDGSEQIVPIAKKDVPDARATGLIIFTNKTDQPIHLPRGSFVATSSGVPVRFQTSADADLAARGRAEVNITAIEPGPSGNVAKFAINTAEGPFALALNVINANGTGGGTVKRVPVVSDEDKRRVADVLRQRLRQEAISRFKAALQENEFVPEDTVTVTLESTTYDKFVDEAADLLTLAAHATARGLIVNGVNANIVALEQLKAKQRDGFELFPDSVEFQPGAVLAADPDSVSFELTAKGRAASAIDRSLIINTLRNMSRADAEDWLTTRLTLRRPPVIELKSDWLERDHMPFFTFRMQVDVVQ